MNIECHQASRSSSRSRYVREYPSQSESSRHVTLVLHSLRSSSGEERKNKCKRRYEKLGESIDNRELFEDHSRWTERSQEGHVLPTNALSILYEQIRESIVKFPTKKKKTNDCEYNFVNENSIILWLHQTK